MATRALVPRWWGATTRRVDPLRLLTSARELDAVFNGFFTGEWPAFETTRASSAYLPNINIEETPDSVVLSAELPGVSPENISLNLSEHGDVLTLIGDKKYDSVENEEGHGYKRLERSFGAFRRDIPLPARVQFDKAKAVLNDGVLSITLAKLVDDPQVRKIDIKTA